MVCGEDSRARTVGYGAFVFCGSVLCQIAGLELTACHVRGEIVGQADGGSSVKVVERLGLFDRTIGAVGDGLQGDVKHPYIVRQRGCCLLLGLCQVFCVRLAGGDENGLISGGESLL